MAVINIAFGGQNIGVEIPDLAMESTLQDVAAEAKAQTNFLSGIAQAIGADSDQQVRVQRETSRDIEQAIQEGNKDRKSMMGGLVQYTRQTVEGLNKSVMGIKGDEKLSGLSSGLLGALGLGAIGGQLGTMFGIMEEFGQNMGNLRRVGTGYLENLQKLRAEAADIGLGLEGLSSIIVDNGITVRALGTNTTEGTNALINMTKQFRENTRAAGYFGMSSEEMSRLLIDEAENRRRIMGIDIQSADAQAEMVRSVETQLKLNESMAKLTGQDIRDRIKASQNFRADAVNAAILANLNGEQARAAKSAVEGLTQLGPSMQGPVQQAITNMLGGFDMFTNNMDFASFAQMAEAAGVDVRGAIQNITAMIDSGASDVDIQAAADQLANQLKNIDTAMLTEQALGGNAGALSVLQTRVESVSSGADTMAGSIANINTSMAELTQAIADRTTELAGTQADMQVIGQGFRNQLMDSMLKAFGVDDIADRNGAAQFTNLLNSLERLPENEKFQGFVDSMSHMVTLTSGAQGLVKLLQGVSLDPGDAMFLGGASADALGFNKLADALRGAGNLTLGDDVIEMFSKVAPDTSNAVYEAMTKWAQSFGPNGLPVEVKNIIELFNPDSRDPRQN